MADPTFLSGKHGYVVIEDPDDDTGLQVEYPFAEWSLRWHTEFLKRNTFMSGGKQNGISGFQSGKLTLRGPMALGLALLIQGGGTYLFFLGVSDDDDVDFQMTAHVSDVNPSNKAEDGPMLELECDSIGDFDIVTV